MARHRARSPFADRALSSIPAYGGGAIAAALHDRPTRFTRLERYTGYEPDHRSRTAIRVTVATDGHCLVGWRG